MSDGNQGWMAAAKGCEGPRPGMTFADLPRQDKTEILRVAVVSAAAAAYFVTMGVLTKPIPSRSLVSGAALPSAPAPRPALLDARDTPSIDPARSRSRRTQAAPVAVTYEPAVLRTRAAARTSHEGSASRKERRGGFFSRLFRGLGRSVQPGNKVNSP